MEGTWNNLLNADFIVHEEVGASDHDPKGRAEEGDEQRDAANTRTFECNPPFSTEPMPHSAKSQ